MRGKIEPLSKSIVGFVVLPKGLLFLLRGVYYEGGVLWGGTIEPNIICYEGEIEPPSKLKVNQVFDALKNPPETGC